MTTPITTFPITGFTILDLALVSPAAGQFLEVGGSSDGRVDIDALATYCRAGLAWGDLGAKPTTLAGYGITDAQPLDADLTALAGLATTGVVERTGAGTASTFAVSAFAKTLLDDANQAAMQGTLGLLIGTNVQAWNARLDSVAALSATSGAIEKTGANTFGTYTVTANAKQLLDDTTFPAMRTTLGATTVGSNLFTLANPGAITFPRFNADNSVSSLNAADFRTAISAQAADPDLTTLAGLSWGDGNFIVGNGFAWTVESGATARTSLGIPNLGNWITLTLTFGANFSQAGVGAHPNRIRVNEFLRLVMVEFSVGTGANNPADGDTIFSWSSAYALPASPTFKYCNISYANVTPYPLVYLEGAAIKFLQDLSPDGAISFLIGNALYIY